MDVVSNFRIASGLFFLIAGFISLFFNIIWQKKGKILTFPWRKALYGRRSSWWIKRDDLDDWLLYWNFLIFNYVVSFGVIIGGVILILIGTGIV